ASGRTAGPEPPAPALAWARAAASTSRRAASRVPTCSPPSSRTSPPPATTTSSVTSACVKAHASAVGQPTGGGHPPPAVNEHLPSSSMHFHQQLHGEFALHSGTFRATIGIAQTQAPAEETRMLRVILFPSLLAGFYCVATAGGQEPRLPRDNLLLYRGADGKPVAVKSVEDWAKRRAEVVRGMETVMGKLPGEAKRCTLDVKVEEEVDGGTYVRRLITYASEPGSRVPAYLLIPKDVLDGKKKAPAVLCLHGTNNVIGHGIIVGLGDTPNRGYALELAQRGYVTLAPNYPLLAKYQPDLKTLGWESGTLKAVWDNRRGLDLLASLPFVDHSKGFGAIGHSLGGHNSVYTAVFDDRLKVIVSSCGLDSYLDYYNGDPKNWDPERGWCQTRYMRKLADYKGRLADIPFDF